MHTRLGKDVEIDTRTDQQPELPESDGPQMIERVDLFAESDIEHVFRTHKKPAYKFLKEGKHYCWPRN